MTTNLGTDLVRSDVDAGVATVTLGNGRRRNALTRAAWTSLENVVAGLGADPAVRVVVVRGRGGTFCSGSDLTEWAGADADLVEDSFARMESAFRAVEQCQVPVVAAITGVAAGAGCQLALACDLRFIADSAHIGMPIARHGILASPAFAARLSTLVGPGPRAALHWSAPRRPDRGIGRTGKPVLRGRAARCICRAVGRENRRTARHCGPCRETSSRRRLGPDPRRNRTPADTGCLPARIPCLGGGVHCIPLTAINDLMRTYRRR
jgi:enoyl-CoA hydratase/carnithine racemase